MKLFFIALLWIAYCVQHSFLISIRFTNLMKRTLKQYYAFYRLFYTIISFVLLVPLIMYSVQSDQNIIIHYPMALNLVRIALIFGSIVMVLWVFFFNYDPLTFLGIRQILNTNKKNNSNLKGEIKKSGLLGLMRHPMYFAVIIFLWCHTFKMVDIVVNAILTIYVIIGTLLEERKLVLEFGEAYKQYQKEVPMIFPFTKFKTSS